MDKNPGNSNQETVTNNRPPRPRGLDTTVQETYDMSIKDYLIDRRDKGYKAKDIISELNTANTTLRRWVQRTGVEGIYKREPTKHPVSSKPDHLKWHTDMGIKESQQSRYFKVLASAWI